MKNNNSKMIGGALLVGSAAGALLALLYAPKAGVETRKDLRKTVLRIRENAMDVIDEAIDDVNEFSVNLKEKTIDLREKGIGVSDRAKKEIVATIEEGQKRIERHKERLTRALGMTA